MAHIQFGFLLASGLLLALPAAAEDFNFELRVVPRIGLFNKLQYKASPADPKPRGLREVETAWDPLKPGDYADIVSKRNPALAALLPAQWDMLTTDPLHAGYRSRRLIVTLTGARPATDCVLSFTNPRGERLSIAAPGEPARYSFSSPDCRFDALPRIPSNEKLTATLAIAGRPSPLTREVPEDFLIVSLGDSYAAGQGNPDGQCVRGGLLWMNPCAERAVWMDERCHRSAQAATIQAGLRMIRDDGRQAARPDRRGAYTIVSLACSGAKLAVGILEEYEGQIDLTKFRDNNKDRGLVAAGTLLEKDDKLPDQLGALQAVLDGQDHKQAKRTIDVMTLTIGGNDTGFAAALTDMILRRQQGRTLLEVETVLADKLDRLRARLPEMGARLADLRRHVGYEVLQMMYTEYPDPTRVGIEPDVFCAGVPADGLLGDLAEAVGAKLSLEETASAFRVVVRGLNRIVADLSFDSAWRAVDGIMNDRNLIGRGWCGTKERWFRKVDESLGLQGNIAGAMHPSWQMHEAIATRILEHVDSGIGAKLEARLQNPAVENPGGLVVRPPLSLAVRDGNAAGAARLVCYGFPEESCNASGEFALDRDRPASIARMLHTASARWFSTPIGAIALDRQPPRLVDCEIFKGGRSEDCNSGTWLTDGAELRAKFEDQGVAGLEYVQWSTAPRDIATVATAPQRVQDELRLKNEIPTGRHVLYLAAADRVGNVTNPADERHSILVRVDRNPPELRSVSILGYDFAGHPQPHVIPVRIKDEGVQIHVTAQDAGSGVGRIEVVVDPAGTAVPYARDERSVCPALGQLEVNAIMERIPFFVEITGRTGGAGESVPARLVATDCAGNAAPASLMLLKIRSLAGDPKPAPPAYWQQPDRATELLRTRVAAMGGQDALPPRNPDSFQWALAAGWLNLAAGMQDPLAKTGSAIGYPSCRIDPGESTAFALIKRAQACLDGPLASSEEAKIAFLATLAPALGALYAP